MRTAPALARADYEAAAKATAAGSRSFYFASRFLPRDLARAAHAVYWFCRYTDDLVDEPNPPCSLDEWEAALRSALLFAASEHPVLAAFVDTVQRYKIPHEYAFDLIRGMRMDLEHRGYETFEELRVFCYRAASVVGLMMCHIIGFRGGALRYAEDLGIAMQLTNILRDVGTDLANGRIYLPREEMRRFGYSEADLRDRVRDSAFRELMRFQIARARELYARAEAGIELLEPRGQFAIRAASRLYAAILDEIEAGDFEVFQTRAVVPLWKKLSLVARPAVESAVRRSTVAALAGVVVNLAAYHAAGVPLWTDVIAEWIMAYTPSRYAVAILASMGPWAKPAAASGGLFTLGVALFVAAFAPFSLAVLAVMAAAFFAVFHYPGAAGLLFWIAAAVVIQWRPVAAVAGGRRTALVTTAGAALVVAESYLREQFRDRAAPAPRALYSFTPPKDEFAPGLVRKAITPVNEFYGMSKNTVDPLLHADDWQLRLTVNGRQVRTLRYADLMAMPQQTHYVTLRCISNTLESDLMGTAQWSGISLSQLLTQPGDAREVAFIGVDGHGDSLPVEYAYSADVLLALGMNGATLTREHGFPMRLLAPRYYGFKNIKWIGEIAWRTEPYVGTWPKMGWEKEAVIHTASHIDRVERTREGLLIGGVSFAGDRGIRAVEVRVDGGPWAPAKLDVPLPGRTWTRWYAALAVFEAKVVEARAQDGLGAWQRAEEKEMFPDGVAGPTRKRVDL